MSHKLRIKQSAAVLLALCLTACGGGKTSETAGDSAATDSTVVVAADTTAQSADKAAEFLRSLPSPFHVANIFKRSGLKYIDGITNPADLAGKYQSVNSQALNLGVYSADLAYSTLNNQSQRSMTYFKAVRTLGDKLQMSSIFEQSNLLNRFEKNIGKPDSLLMLMGELHMESDILLKAQDRHDVVFLSFAGAWVESLYIATHLTKSGGDPKTLSRIQERVLDQSNALGTLIKLLGDYQQKQEYDSLIKGLTEVRDAMNEITALNKPTTDAAYQEKYNKSLYPKIEALRKQIVSGF
ncbi:MAG: hypothetical protein V4543_16885 [Bacteroidota bacterium]